MKLKFLKFKSYSLFLYLTKFLSTEIQISYTFQSGFSLIFSIINFPLFKETSYSDEYPPKTTPISFIFNSNVSHYDKRKLCLIIFT